MSPTNNKPKPPQATQQPDATEAGRLLVTKPPHRRLRVFSLDPAVDAKLEHSLISRSVLKVAWEENLKPGPVGEYLEVIDVDPSSGCVYDPVNLTERNAARPGRLVAVDWQPAVPPADGLRGRR